MTPGSDSEVAEPHKGVTDIGHSAIDHEKRQRIEQATVPPAFLTSSYMIARATLEKLTDPLFGGENVTYGRACNWCLAKDTGLEIAQQGRRQNDSPPRREVLGRMVAEHGHVAQRRRAE